MSKQTENKIVCVSGIPVLAVLAILIPLCLFLFLAALSDDDGGLLLAAFLVAVVSGIVLRVTP